MNQFPVTFEALVVRTDFSADGAWEELREALFSPSQDGFLANVALVDDRRYEGLTPDRALDLNPRSISIHFWSWRTLQLSPRLNGRSS
ncbi:hypothetical protein ABZ027_31570 [Streptomyces sp. NPDC006332]|uniref:DUF6924 domain-containing protein n=1 Tax=Streptomyces sp. NPDC006332 TaxID=3155456 RepID=UPI0033B61B50